MLKYPFKIIQKIISYLYFRTINFFSSWTSCVQPVNSIFFRPIYLWNAFLRNVQYKRWLLINPGRNMAWNHKWKQNRAYPFWLVVWFCGSVIFRHNGFSDSTYPFLYVMLWHVPPRILIYSRHYLLYNCLSLRVINSSKWL